MANITNEINKINTAIYGKEVRGALSNGLIAMNDEIENMETNVSNMDNEVKTLGQTVSSTVLDIHGLKNQTETNMANAQNTLNKVNDMISEAQKNGTMGLPLSGGTLTGPLNLSNGNAGLEIEGTTVLAVDSNNRVILNGSGTTSNGKQLEETFNDGDFDNFGSYKMKGATIISLDSNNNLCINSGDKLSNGKQFGDTYNNGNFDNFGNFKIKGARVLYLDSNNNICINSNDNLSNGNALGTTNVTGNFAVGGSIDISQGFSLTQNSKEILSSVDYITLNPSNSFAGVNLNGVVQVNGKASYNLVKSIPANTDFNTLTQTGFYYVNNNSTASTFKNCPNGISGILEVYNTGDGQNANSQGFIYQRWTTTFNTQATNSSETVGIYTRSYYGYQSTQTNGSPWSLWQSVFTNNYSNGRGYAVQLYTLGKSVSELALENNQLKQQNAGLGKQVINLSLENGQMKQQIKTLAQTMIKQQLGGK